MKLYNASSKSDRNKLTLNSDSTSEATLINSRNTSEDNSLANQINCHLQKTIDEFDDWLNGK